MIGSHGCVSSLSVVMCNEPYRNYATGPFQKTMEKEEISKNNEDTRNNSFYTLSRLLSYTFWMIVKAIVKLNSTGCSCG
ncbi:hypothetical protein COOONC_19980 [Cooperia oncophora]